MIAIKERNKAYDLARILACIFVISAHITSWWKYDDLSTMGWKIGVIFDGFSRWALPMFFMISGACSKGIDVNKNLKKIIKYFIIFIVVTVIYALSESIFYYLESNDFIFRLFSTGFNTKYHLWFISQFILVLSIAPILNYALDKQEGLYKYLLILWVITCVLPVTLTCAFNGIIDSKLLMIVSKAPTFLTGNYIGYYVLGKYLAIKKEDNKISIPVNVILYLTSWVAIVFLTVKYTNRFGALQESWTLEVNNVFVVIQSIVVFKLFSRIELKNKTLIKISALSKYTFFVYLFHPLIMDILWYFKFGETIKTTNYIPMIIKIPISVIVVFILTLLLAIIYKFIENAISNRILRKE